MNTVALSIGGDPKELDLIIERGSDPVLRLVFVDQDTKLPIDVSGFTWSSSLFPDYNNSSTVDFAIDVTQANVGIIDCSFTKAQTTDKTKVQDKGIWEFWWKDSSGKREKKIYGAYKSRRSAGGIA